jgi:signal recognition particle subunit SEC65
MKMYKLVQTLKTQVKGILQNTPQINTIPGILKELGLEYNKQRANACATALRELGYKPHHVRVYRYRTIYIWIKDEENYVSDL